MKLRSHLKLRLSRSIRARSSIRRRICGPSRRRCRASSRRPADHVHGTLPRCVAAVEPVWSSSSASEQRTARYRYRLTNRTARSIRSSTASRACGCSDGTLRFHTIKPGAHPIFVTFGFSTVEATPKAVSPTNGTSIRRNRGGSGEQRGQTEERYELTILKLLLTEGTRSPSDLSFQRVSMLGVPRPPSSHRCAKRKSLSLSARHARIDRRRPVEDLTPVRIAEARGLARAAQYHVGVGREHRDAGRRRDPQLAVVGTERGAANRAAERDPRAFRAPLEIPKIRLPSGCPSAISVSPAAAASAVAGWGSEPRLTTPAPTAASRSCPPPSSSATRWPPARTASCSTRPASTSAAVSPSSTRSPEGPPSRRRAPSNASRVATNDSTRRGELLRSTGKSNNFTSTP